MTPSTPKTPTTPSPKPTAAGWCVPKAGISDAQLQASLDYACSQGIDCSPIQPGGACFEPNTVVSHAAFAMNLYYQTSAKNPWNCDFSKTATLTSQNPSKLNFIIVSFLNFSYVFSFCETRLFLKSWWLHQLILVHMSANCGSLSNFSSA